MDRVVNLMVNKYKLKEFGLDFMGYRIKNSKDLTYHHLVIPRKNGGKESVENGAILVRKSHQYLHMIERREHNLFLDIRELLIEENKKGLLDLVILRDINNLLYEFENNNDVDNIYKNRFLYNMDAKILNEIDKYELIRSR